MRPKTLFVIALALVTLAVAAGCAAPAKPLTVSIVENECTYDGPNAIPKGEFTVKLTTKAQKPTEAGFGLIALEEGKTVEDFKAWPSTEKPPFVMDLAGATEFTAGDFSYTYDSNTFKSNIAYKGQPAYLLCFRANPDTGAFGVIGGPFGPIEVKQ